MLPPHLREIMRSFRQKPRMNARTKLNIKMLIAFLIGIIFCGSLTIISIVHRQELQRLGMEQLISQKSNEVEVALAKLLYKTEALAALVIHSNGQVRNFAETASVIVDDPSILNILIAPNGVVSHVYPVAGNERVLGFNMLGPGPGNREAYNAYMRGELILGGPFTLVQGGEALVGRYPVFLSDGSGGRRFWGLVSVTLKHPQALAGAGLDSLYREDLGYEIWRISPDTGKRQVVARSAYEFKQEPYIERTMHLMGAEWHFRIMPIRYWYEHPENWLFILGSLFISGLLAMLVRNNSRLNIMHDELHSLLRTDSLTRVMNRVGLFHRLEALIREKRPFLLFYMDLNEFKKINDTYGHTSGDHALCEFCRRFEKHLGKNHLLARISGDEFVLIKLCDKSPCLPSQSFWEKIEYEFQKPFYTTDGTQIMLYYSVGSASYPEDGSSIDAIIGMADERMYQNRDERYTNERKRQISEAVVNTGAGGGSGTGKAG